jgi:hypothetical protein
MKRGETQVDVVLAQRDWFVLQAFSEKDDPDKITFWSDEIIAWRIETEYDAVKGECSSKVTPIIADRFADDDLGLGEGGMILRPDGCVCWVGNTVFDNIDLALKEYIERMKAYRDQQSKRDEATR